MKIRTELPNDHRLEEGHRFERVFYGDCHGIGLSKRGQDDNHVMFTVLTQDDEYWFVSNVRASTAWMPELVELMQHVLHWVEKNCKPDMHEGRQYGWRFKWD